VEYNHNQKTGMTELIINEYDIAYQTSNRQIYTVEIYDNASLDGIAIMCTDEEFIRILNNPRLAFVL
jgi:hypothetical protein